MSAVGISKFGSRSRGPTGPIGNDAPGSDGDGLGANRECRQESKAHEFELAEGHTDCVRLTKR